MERAMGEERQCSVERQRSASTCPVPGEVACLGRDLCSYSALSTRYHYSVLGLGLCQASLLASVSCSKSARVLAPASRASRISRCSNSAVASASPAARWRALFSNPKKWLRLSRLLEGSAGSSRRASRTVQSRVPARPKPAGPADFRGQEAPVEPCVMRHKDAPGQRGEEPVGNLLERWRGADQVIADAGQHLDSHRDRTPQD